MKLATKSVAPAILLGLCIGLAGGCGSKKPPGTNPPGEDGGGKAGKKPKKRGGGNDAGGDGGSVADGGDGGDGGEAAAPTTCEAKVADTPTLLFGDQVIIRPPVGVEFPPDENPMVQTAIMSGGFMSACDAIIKRMMVFVYEVDKKKKPAKLMDEFISTLESQGYAGGTRSEAYVDTATDYHMSVEYGGGGGNSAVVLYLGVARRGDKDFIVMLESEPADFKLLKPTYEESAKSLFVVPPDA
ncbi:hypothetical protein [Paraliomyxa miuraensis]|uniref:hypothetical protein n=1 Tax=Paraliomyxa miuraensis TaxID=376150 RepID=UPI0022572AB7|nr:hypothetical protein [Paraliomyxa miuraensis]MCX4239938.1 hypothetical protein [Paraliomyxa miuraensis]